MTVAASMVVVRTDRGDDMFMTWLARNAQQAIDLDALSLLPDPGDGRPPALRPEPEDEGTHAPGAEETWNESWYFDVVSDDASLGAYVRIGRLPNRDVALYTAAIVGPGRPAVLVVDGEAPLPAADDPSQRIEAGGLVAEQRLRVAARALPGQDERPGGGVRRRVGAASLRARPPGRGRARPRLGDRGHPVPVAARDPLRDPLPGHRHGDRRRRADRGLRARPARPLVGRARLVGDRLDVERVPPRGRDADPHGHRSAGRGLRRRLCPAATARSTRSRPRRRPRRSPTTA